MPRYAVVSAMQEELRALTPLLECAVREPRGGREFHLGRLAGRDVVLVQSGIGKVAAAITATLLLETYAVDALLLTGVAGGVRDGVGVGDLVVADELLQHDMDASPLFPRYEVPLAGRARFAADADATASALAGAARVLADGTPVRRALAQEFGIAAPGLHRGLVISGDRFVASAAASQALRVALPDALAVEMEGAAVAQVCAAYQRPFALVRIVSDRADDAAHVDFVRFVEDVAAVASRELALAWLEAH